MQLAGQGRGVTDFGFAQDEVLRGFRPDDDLAAMPEHGRRARLVDEERHHVRLRALVEVERHGLLVTSFAGADDAKAPGQPPCFAITSSISVRILIVSEMANKTDRKSAMSDDFSVLPFR